MKRPLKQARKQLKKAGWDRRRPALLVVGAQQRLHLLLGKKIVLSYPVSTGRAGFGNAENSGKTPVGLHRICARIGQDEPLGRVFRARRATDQIRLHPDPNEADPVTTRILWLEGLEPGRNRGPGVDSRQRFIYIHGTPRVDLIGAPVSMGCVRMTPEAVRDLFDRVGEGALVLILPPKGRP